MKRSAAVLCMGGSGHVRALLPVVGGLGHRGYAVHVWTRREFRDDVERCGGIFADLYAGRSLESADATSMPIPVRFVSFAGVHAGSLAAEIASTRPQVMVHDTFTVVAPVIARRLGIPHVAVHTNHAPVPARMVADLERDPRVRVSAECRAALDDLRREPGMEGAHPFSYYESTSPLLNLYCEPAELLDAAERASLEPLAFLGSPLPPERSRDTARERSTRRTIYVSFGTGVWRYYEPEATAAMSVVATALHDAEVVISLGGHPLAEATRRELGRPNVRVADFLDQWELLAEVGVFVTHHGRSSTHEAIFHEVPMLSYPFFGDQPALARRCQELGLAIPLAGSPREALSPDAIGEALARLRRDRESFAARLRLARSWEIRTLRERDAVFDRIASLASTS